MRERDAHIHGRVLESLHDGVLVVSLGGAIAIFNPAASRILGVSREAAAGRRFAEVFIPIDGLDALTGTVLDAIGGAGEDERKVVSVQVGGEERSLSVATSYLTRVRDGEREPVAVVAVFSDITELWALREAELRMAKAVEAQHAELQQAYREIEDRNESLATMLKRVQVARVAVTVLVVGVFVGVGAWSWKPLGLSLEPPAGLVADAEAGPGGESEVRTVTVRPRAVSATVALVGRLAPVRTVTVPGPVDAKVAAVHFRYGEEVAEGAVLVELDTAALGRAHRKARLAYLEALAAHEAMERWESGPEMAEARRSVTKAKLSMDDQETRRRKAELLHGQGLISDSEHQEAMRQYKSQRLDFEAAQEELEAVRAQGGEEAREKARLGLEDARDALREREAALSRGVVRAPIAGVVLAQERERDAMTVGRSLRAGDTVAVIGDFSRMSALTQVDEVDVGSLAPGQPVTVTGNAFPGLTLRGTVSRVAAQAGTKAKRGPPMFDVVVTLDALESEQRARLRAGMSSNLRIVVYSNPRALTVPIEAVRRRGATSRVRVLERASGEVREREVETGPTTLDSVEIVAGLSPGDEVVVAEQ